MTASIKRYNKSIDYLGYPIFISKTLDFKNVYNQGNIFNGFNIVSYR